MLIDCLDSAKFVGTTIIIQTYWKDYLKMNQLETQQNSFGTNNNLDYNRVVHHW